MSNHTIKQQLEILLNMSVYVAEMQLTDEGRSATYALINSIAEEFDIELEDDMVDLMDDAGIQPYHSTKPKTKPSLSVIHGSKESSSSDE